jgi:hypothetical protein
VGASRVTVFARTRSWPSPAAVHVIHRSPADPRLAGVEGSAAGATATVTPEITGVLGAGAPRQRRPAGLRPPWQGQAFVLAVGLHSEWHLSVGAVPAAPHRVDPVRYRGVALLWLGGRLGRVHRPLAPARAGCGGRPQQPGRGADLRCRPLGGASQSARWMRRTLWCALFAARPR